MPDRPLPDIGEAFEQVTLIDEAMNEAVLEAIRHHKRMGQPLAVWRNGATVWISPEEAEAEYYRNFPASK